MNFAEHLIRLRKQHGLSQEQLAETLDVSRQAVSKWESGINTPDIPKLIAIADEFGITLDALLRPDFSAGNGKATGTKGNGNIEADTGAVVNIIGDGKAYTLSSGTTVYIKSGFYEYISKIKIGGIPLVHIRTGSGFQCARGIIAIGNMAVGVVAVGGVSAGLFSLGGISIGLLLALGGTAIGSISLGGVSLGLTAFGGMAVGIRALGGLALGKIFAAGGAAYGPVSIGENIEAAFRLTEHTAHEDLLRYMEENASAIPVFLRKLFLQ